MAHCRTPSVACGDSSLRREPFGTAKSRSFSKPPCRGRWHGVSRDGGSSREPPQSRLISNDIYFMEVRFKSLLAVVGLLQSHFVRQLPQEGAFWQCLISNEIYFIKVGFRRFGSLPDFLISLPPAPFSFVPPCAIWPRNRRRGALPYPRG